MVSFFWSSYMPIVPCSVVRITAAEESPAQLCGHYDPSGSSTAERMLSAACLRIHTCGLARSTASSSQGGRRKLCWACQVRPTSLSSQVCVPVLRFAYCKCLLACIRLYQGNASFASQAGFSRCATSQTPLFQVMHVRRNLQCMTDLKAEQCQYLAGFCHAKGMSHSFSKCHTGLSHDLHFDDECVQILH